MAAETETEQKTSQKEIASAVVGACDPDDRLRATEGCFLMTDMADVESIAEPTNNGKVVPKCLAFIFNYLQKFNIIS